MIVRLHGTGPVEIITANEGASIAHGEGQMYSIEPHKNVWACTCDRSKNYPLCDGSHNNEDEMVVIWGEKLRSKMDDLKDKILDMSLGRLK